MLGQTEGGGAEKEKLEPTSGGNVLKKKCDWGL